MNRNKKITMAVLAGASAVFMGTSAKAALQIEAERTASVTFNNGTYDVIDIILTNMTATAGPGLVTADLGSGVTPTVVNAGGFGDNTFGATTTETPPVTPDPEVLGLSGTFAATGAGIVLGTPGSTNGASHIWSKYIDNGGVLQYGGSAFGGSFVALPQIASGQTIVGQTGASASSSATLAGTSTAIQASWTLTPASTGLGSDGGNEGGIQPGIDASELGEPNGLVAEILVTHNGGFTYTGSYGDYGNGGNAQSLAFTVDAVGSVVPPTNAIVSLTTVAPTTYGNLAGTVTATGTGTSYVAGTKAITPPSGKAYVNGVLSGTPSGTTEIYALDITNSTGGAPTDLTAIDSAIAAITGVTAVSGTNPGPFPAGYNVFITFNPAPTPASNFLGFDLTGTGSDTDLVASVALVPEPASAAFILVGASSLLLGRRKRATSQVA
jgi:hypothetical protein